MKLPLFLLALLVSFGESCSAAVFYGPTPYRQRSDSPFYAGIQRGTIYLEDFEDRQLNTPYAILTTGRAGIFQGVDEDDGILNERGLNYVWYNTSAVPGAGAPWTHEIKFSPNPGGQYPLFVGLVLPGHNAESSILDVIRLYQFFDANGNSLSPDPLSMMSPRVPDNTPEESTLGDRFVGAYSELGISRVLLGATARFDHLQYGYSIPEPGSAGLLALAGMALLRRRRRE
jgi:hypothetical protein